MKSSLRERGYPVPFFYTMEVKMFRNRFLKILALLMVLNILIIPLTSFSPSHQNKYTVHAEAATISVTFFGAVLALIGITAYMQGNISSTFSIPETDLLALKDQFAQTLEADAAKKSAWMQAQTDYLAGGVAKTMGAVELAKIGVNDIYTELKNYLKSKIDNAPNDTLSEASIVTNYDNYYVVTKLIRPLMLSNFIYTYTRQYGSPIYVAAMEPNYVKYGSSYNYIYEYDYYDLGGNKVGMLAFVAYQGVIQCETLLSETASLAVKRNIYNKALTYGVDLRLHYPTILNDVNIKGAVTYNNTGDIINANTDTISVLPTIPWIDNTVPVGTIVNPEISAPYAGTVPIDVPITAPIDPPIDEPVDPPADTTLLGTVAAILAGITPISAILDNILASELDIADVIEVGITGVIDGIGDIAGTLTGGITSSLTDIQTKIDSLFDPPTDTINFDKIKNLNSVMFTKFPFSIPFDFIAMITAFNGDPVAPVLKIPFDLTSLGGENTELEFDLSRFDYIASIARQINFIGFAFFMLFNTRKFIWK